MLRSGRKKNEPGAMPGSLQSRRSYGWASGFDIANHRPDGKTPTKTIGSLHGRGRSTVAVMCELPPGTVAEKRPVETLTIPSGVRQLTVASKFAIGLIPPSKGITRPFTVTSTTPCWLTGPVPDAIAHGTPPPMSPRTTMPPTGMAVIDEKSVRLPFSSANVGTALAAITPPTHNAVTTTLPNIRMAKLLRRQADYVLEELPAQVTCESASTRAAPRAWI